MTDDEEESEYESDPEESALSLTMRRRVASDDEEGEGEAARPPLNSRVSDAESDGLGGPDVYDDEESEIEEELLEEEEEKASDQIAPVGPDSEQRSSGEQQAEVENKDPEEEGEKKEQEPCAVPTAGAFYMHDDRFRDNAGPSAGAGAGAPRGGRNRRIPGGKKLWESKDDRKWGHDKFEEMNIQEKQYDKERRNSKGQYKGRGKTHGLDQRHARGNHHIAYDGKNTQNQTVRTMRGRGPRRYEPLTKNNRDTFTLNQRAGKSHESTSNTNPRKVFTKARTKNQDTPTQNQPPGSHESTSYTNSRRVSTNTWTPNVQSDFAPPRKHAFASNLNSASPPFYPSGTFIQDISQTQKEELPVGNTSTNLRPSVLSETKVAMSHSVAAHRGKNVADVMDKVCSDEERFFHELFNKMQVQTSGPLPVITTQSPEVKSKGGAAISEQTSYHSLRVSQQTQVSVQQRPIQTSAQSSFRASSQQSGQLPTIISQASYLPKTSATTSSDQGEVESQPGSSKSKTAVVGKGKNSVQGNGKGPFLYNGVQVMGASGTMGLSHGDPNFTGGPALLQVMQFGGQHPGGLGVPAVGMALPGYIAQLGFGSSEMTWLPVLAGAAGAIGASYCSPYLAVDGGYYSRPTGQTTFSGAPSKETNAAKPTNVLKPTERTEPVNDEFGQRQNKPRRYSEMNFGQ